MQFANQFVSFSKFSVLLRGECESALRPMKVLVACFGVALGCERIGGEYYSGQNFTYHTNGMNMNADYCCGWCCGAKGQGARSYAWKDMSVHTHTHTHGSCLLLLLRQRFSQNITRRYDRWQMRYGRAGLLICLACAWQA